MKINKDIHILSAVQIFGRDSNFWQCKVFADIRSGSLERRGKGQWSRALVLVLNTISWLSKTVA